MKRGRFDKKGVLAIASAHWGIDIDVHEPQPFYEENGIAVVEICGPITHHNEWIFDSCDSIKARVAAALASSCKAVVLEIDSPGGDATGFIDTARELRALARESKKPLIAYSSGLLASAAYGLACAADQIVVSSTATAGSVGVIAHMVDATSLDRMLGTKWALVTSGARKADGNPHEPLSNEAVAALQVQVDQLAEEFYALVAEARPMRAADIRALEANTFIGTDAKARGLVDAVMTKSELLSRLASGEDNRPRAATQEKTPMGWKDALKKAAEEGDEEAKKALAALDDDKDGPPPVDDKKSKKAEEEESARKAEEEEARKKAEEDEAAKKAEDEKNKQDAKASANVLDRLGKVERENAELRARAESSDRAAILNARPDLTDGQKQYLASLPIAQTSQ